MGMTDDPARLDRPPADTKWVVGSVIATGGVIATLLLALAGLVIQQNASVNQRIDDVLGEMNRRIDDLSGRDPRAAGARHRRPQAR